MFYGMATMTYRTTFALDEQSIQRLKYLSSYWQVSQAEVIRRSLEQAEQSLRQTKVDPVGLLKELHADGAGLPAEDAALYMTEVRADRKQWRGK